MIKKRTDYSLIAGIIDQIRHGRITDPEKAAVELACNGCCEFYKEQNDEEGCYGFLMLKDMMSRQEVATALATVVAEPENVWINLEKFDNMLKETICRKCLYMADGCDYRNGSVIYENSRKYPCGALILVAIIPRLLKLL